MGNVRNVVVMGAGLAGTSLLSFALGSMVTAIWLMPTHTPASKILAPPSQANGVTNLTIPAPVMPAPPPPSAAPEAGPGPWGLMVGKDISADAAQGLGKRLEALGMPVRLSGSGPNTVVTAGSFPDQRSAQQAAAWLARAENLEAAVVPLPAPDTGKSR